ncbi:hypothetical protein GCM10011351_20620 [Paraliobacillus quinghaiensis]|uniref:Uncharacterized protein n=1 Tax=Paraliobacillus quinghaiensis TaxID=470815 RepID=A0A917TSM1_9BACI|nr:hypothetical protein [Paraliobacillus quinghaiensis]GGM34544.1 hypothetical protein GCM10011351_20620 [Paraliobacillus quinghaiensis]
MKGNIQRSIMFILGGVVGLVIVSTLKDENYLTWNTILSVVIITIIGWFSGTKIKNLLKKD